MKILHLDSEKSWRGGEQQMEWLINELDKMKYINFIGLRENSSAHERFSKLPTPVLTFSFQFRHLISDALKLKRFCAQNAVEIIHAHASKAHTLAVVSAMLGNKSHIIVSRRVDFPVSNTIFSKFKYNHRSVVAYICVSDFVRAVLKKSLKNQKHVVTVYDGIDFQRHDEVNKLPDLRKEFQIPSDAAIIANVAALAPHKDYDTFLKTASLLLSQGIHAYFLIAGDGPERNRVEEQITSMGLGKNIRLCGFRNDIPAFLRSIDLLLYTSKEEGLGSTLLDAQYAGVPIVSTDAGGIPEILPAHAGGISCPVGNVSQLAEKVRTVLTNPTLSQALSESGRLFASTFSIKRMAEDTAAVYNVFKISN